MNDVWREGNSEVNQVLNPGERVIWRGSCLSRQGKQRKAAPSIGVWATVLGAVVGTIAGILVFAVLHHPILMVLAALVSGVATANVAARYLGEGVRDNQLYCRKQTVNVLTNQRAFVLQNCRTPVPVRSAPWRFVEEIEVEGLRPDGRGSVVFTSWDPVARRRQTVLRFFMVWDARGVASQALQERAKSTG